MNQREGQRWGELCGGGWVGEAAGLGLGVWAYRAGLKPEHGFVWPEGRVAPEILTAHKQLKSRSPLGFPVKQHCPIFGRALLWISGGRQGILWMLINNTTQVDLEQRYWCGQFGFHRTGTTWLVLGLVEPCGDFCGVLKELTFFINQEFFY